MHCPACGRQNNDNALRCSSCGETIQGASWVLPTGRSGLAIAAGYAAFFAFLVFPAPIALALGILAVVDIKRHPEKQGMGRALFGLIAGGLGTLILVALIIYGLYIRL